MPTAPVKRLSQEELADRAGINRNYVGMLEREDNSATVDMLEKLADAPNVDPIDSSSDRRARPKTPSGNSQRNSGSSNESTEQLRTCASRHSIHR